MVLLGVAMVLLGGCYCVVDCYGVAWCCYGVARWLPMSLLGVARWLLWCCYGCYGVARWLL